MSEENKQEKVKVKIQGREFELTKLPNGRYSGKISFKIGGIKNKDIYVDKTSLGFDANGNISIISFPAKSPQKISFKIGDIENKDKQVSEISFGDIVEDDMHISFKEPQPISFKIGDIENKDKQASDIVFWNNGYVKKISFKEPQPISFKIGDIENKDKQASSVGCDYYDVEEITFINFKEPQPISFKIGDIENKDKQASDIFFYYQDNRMLHDVRCIIFKEPQPINFRINNHYVKMTRLSFYGNSVIESFVLAENFEGNFSYNGEDFHLSFNKGDNVIFDPKGDIAKACIDQLKERYEFRKIINSELKKIETEQTKTNQKVEKLQEVQNLATKEDWRFVKITGIIGAICIGGCVLFCIFNNTIGLIFNYNFNYEHETFNRYTFLYEILKRAPIIILVILGFKFLQLAFERLRLIGEVEKVQKYIKLTTDDDTKKQLLKMIAIPFFAQKKVKSSFFDRLIDKFPINIPINIGSERENSGVISKDKQNHS